MSVGGHDRKGNMELCFCGPTAVRYRATNQGAGYCSTGMGGFSNFGVIGESHAAGFGLQNSNVFEEARNGGGLAWLYVLVWGESYATWPFPHKPLSARLRKSHIVSVIVGVLQVSYVTPLSRPSRNGRVRTE